MIIDFKRQFNSNYTCGLPYNDQRIPTLGPDLVASKIQACNLKSHTG